MIEEGVVLSLLLRLHQEVDIAGGGGLLGRRLGRGGTGGRRVAKVGRRALVLEVARVQVLVVLHQGHELAGDEKSLAIEGSLAVWIRMVPYLREKEYIHLGGQINPSPFQIMNV